MIIISSLCNSNWDIEIHMYNYIIIAIILFKESFKNQNLNNVKFIELIKRSIILLINSNFRR